MTTLTQETWQIFNVNGTLAVGPDREHLVAWVDFWHDKSMLVKKGLAEQQANASLLAGAPTLLEACRFILSQLDPDGANGAQCKLYSDCLHPTDDNKTVVDFLQEAIAKAGGGQ